MISLFFFAFFLTIVSIWNFFIFYILFPTVGIKLPKWRPCLSFSLHNRCSMNMGVMSEVGGYVSIPL